MINSAGLNSKRTLDCDMNVYALPKKTELFFLLLSSDSRNEIFTTFLTVITTPRLVVSVIIKRKVVPTHATRAYVGMKVQLHSY